MGEHTVTPLEMSQNSKLLQILKNCTNRGNRTITSGSRWQRVLKKRQRRKGEN